MERRGKCVPLINRWKNIKKNAKRNVKKEMIKFYNIQETQEQATSEISDTTETIHQQQSQNQTEEIQAENDKNKDQQQSQTEHQQQMQIEDQQNQIDEQQQSQCSGEQYVKELWEKTMSNWNIELDEDNMPDTARNEVFRESMLHDIKSWASNHSITHMAIHDLMKVLNKQIPKINLPIDGRTVMETPRQVKIVDDMALGGKYWHYGIQPALFNALLNEKINNNMTIHLTVNIDGLPLYNSSQIEFWPILVKVFEYDHIPPLIIGIYCGRGKQSA